MRVTVSLAPSHPCPAPDGVAPDCSPLPREEQRMSPSTRIGALAAGGALIAAGLVVLAAEPASAAATGGVGATLPYVEVQAENSATNGTVIGPSAAYNTLAAEASYRKAVTLQGTGKYVEFTTPVRDELDRLPLQHPGHRRRVGLHGAAVPLRQRDQAAQLHPDQRLQLVLRRLPVHQLAGQQPAPLLRRGRTASSRPPTRPAPSSGCRSTPRTPPRRTRSTSPTSRTSRAPLAQPAGSVSVTSKGADPTGAADSTAAFNSAIAAAGPGGTVWIPAGHVQDPGSPGPEQRHDQGRRHVALDRRRRGTGLLRQLRAERRAATCTWPTSRSSATSRSATTARRSTASAGR